ncbi:hypothetical protein O9992_03510 [Vibrio lentus]|nr:hypothetical protein [Vibrio lentus]
MVGRRYGAVRERKMQHKMRKQELEREAYKALADVKKKSALMFLRTGCASKHMSTTENLQQALEQAENSLSTAQAKK